MTVTQPLLQFNLHRSDEIHQIDGGHQEKPSKETVLQTHTKTHSTGYRKYSYKPSKTDYELQTIPSGVGVGKQFFSEQNIDRNATTKFDEASNEEICSTKF
jgi:hypothetical protein